MSKLRNRPHAINPTRSDAGIVKPATIAISEAVRVSLNALAGDEQKILNEGQRLNGLLEATRQSRATILIEIEKANNLPAGTLATEYQYNGKELVKATKE